MFEKRSISYNS